MIAVKLQLQQHPEALKRGNAAEYVQNFSTARFVVI
jgi:hypothetical protein